jgi:hypothetical protein
MVDEELQNESAAVEDDVNEEEIGLPFSTAPIVREMRKQITDGKMIKKEVKIAMNRFLADIVKDVSMRMNEYPYSMVDYRMFQEATRPYRMAKEVQKEKIRMQKHMDKIMEDCDSVKRDLEEKFGEDQKF